MKRMLILTLVTAGGVMPAVTPALAQNPDVLRQQAPNMPPQQQMPAEKIEPQDPSSTGSTGTLSDKLDKSEGVIKPPTTATPDMTVKPPVSDPGTMPVIPPPGSPGGDQSVQPK